MKPETGAKPSVENWPDDKVRLAGLELTLEELGLGHNDDRLKGEELVQRRKATAAFLSW